jgi:hypothetical protein
MNSRGSRGSVRSSASQSATSIVRAEIGFSLPSVSPVRPQVSMKARWAARIASMSHAERTDCAIEKPSSSLARKAVIEPGGRSSRRGSSRVARSTSPGASQRPSRSGAKPAQVSAARRR